MNQPVKWIHDKRPVHAPYLELVEDTTQAAEYQDDFREFVINLFIILALFTAGVLASIAS